MSTITLSTLNTIAKPVNTYVPAPANAELLAFAKLVNELNKSGRLSALAPASTPAPAKAPAKAAKPVAKPVVKDEPKRRTKNGGMMSTVRGSITKGQLDKLIALCIEIGDPMSKQEIANARTWSMATASDYRYDILNG